MSALCEATGMTDASKFIDELGGTTAVATLTKDTLSTVSGWRTRGIPIGKLLILMKHAKEKKKTVPPKYREMLP